jgi:protein ImuA
MPQPVPPSALAVARNRAAVMEELRRLLPGRTDFRQSLPIGLTAIDSCLPGGGLACGALHEIVPAPHAQPAALGFATLLARLANSPPPSEPRWRRPECRLGEEGLGVGVESWRGNVHASPQGGREKGGKLIFVLPTYGFREYGRLHGHGLRTLGLDPAHIILVETTHRRDTLWALEEALRSGAPAAVAGFIDKLDLKTSQRLHLAATDSGLPLFLMRPAQDLESSAAATRWHVGTVEAARDRFGLIIRPRWHLQLERCRNGRPGEWIVEYDHVAHRFSLAAALADPARARGTNLQADPANRQSHCA